MFFTETACGDFTSYGITNREGVNRIKGPGLYDSGEAGISHMGGRYYMADIKKHIRITLIANELKRLNLLFL